MKSKNEKIKIQETIELDTYDENQYQGIPQQNDSMISSERKSIKSKLVYEISKQINIFSTNISGFSKIIRCLIKLRNGQIVSGSYDSYIYIWNPNLFLCLNKKHANDCLPCMQHNESIFCLLELHNGILVSGGGDNLIKLWDLNTYECIHTLHGHQSFVCSLMQMINNTLVSSSSDSVIILWNPIQFTKLAVLKGHTNTVCAVIQYDNKSLLSASRDGMLKLWDINTKKNTETIDPFPDIHNYEADPKTGLFSLISLRNGQIIAGRGNGTILVWDIKFKHFQPMGNPCQNGICCIIELNDGHIASGSEDHSISIWDLQAMLCEIVIIGHKSTVCCLLEIDNGLLLSGSCDMTMKVWTLKQLKTQANNQSLIE